MRDQILVVHEEQATRDGLVAALDTAGFMGVPAATGQQALHYLQAGGSASVILLDESAGWIGFRRAQRDPKLAQIPVIAISPTSSVEMLITIVSCLCIHLAEAAGAQTASHPQDIHDESGNVSPGVGRHELRLADFGHVSR